MKTSFRLAVLAGALPVLILLVGIPPRANAECVPPPSGLVAWWPGDNNPTDIIGGHNGTLLGGVSYGTGNVAQAFNFVAGDNDLVEVPNSTALQFGQTLPITIAFWAFRTSSSHDAHIIGIGRNGCDGSDYTCQVLWYTDGHLAFGSPYGGVDADAGLPLNNWAHVACTFDYDNDTSTGTLKLYVDGVEHGSSTGLLGPANNFPLMIGQSGSCASFEGLLDEMQIYNRALTQAEIQGIFNAGTAGNCKTPVTATWKSSPQSGDWNTAANWSTNKVPGLLDTARFRASSTTNISFSANTDIGSISFQPGASPYSLSVNDWEVQVSLTGVTNSSGLFQNWDLDNNGLIVFKNSATAGTLTSYTAEGGSVANGGPGSIIFEDTSTAGAATLTANGDVFPGTIRFLGSSKGDLAQIVCNGGTLDISSHSAPGVTLGSIEGTSGSMLLGGNKLTVGGRNSSTSFSGEIIEGFLTSDAPDAPLAGGSLTKVDAGTLTLGGANTYSGGTTVSAGGLLLQKNGNSSQTGLGNVNVNAGLLGGDGIATGNVTIGDSRGTRAVLAPGFTQEILDLFTTKKKLTFKSDGDFVCEFDSGNVAADKVQAKGVTISPGATFNFSEAGSGTMQIGTKFILIDNTAATPISGTFTGVPEGAQIPFGPYLWKFSYLGGTGNDFSGEVLEQF